MRVTALASVVFLAAACASAPSSSPLLDEVLAAHLAARGGIERIHALNSIRQTGTAIGPKGRLAHIVREIKRPGMFRLEFTFQGTTSVFAHDGNSGWQVAPLQKQFEPMDMPPEADAAGGADQRDIEGALVDWRAKGHTVTLLDREKLDGKDVFKLKVGLNGGGVRYDYIDANTHQMIRSDVTRIIQGRPTVLESTFSDFRPTAGLVFPRHIETRVKDRPQVLQIEIDGIEVNPALDDARFRKP